MDQGNQQPPRAPADGDESVFDDALYAITDDAQALYGTGVALGSDDVMFPDAYDREWARLLPFFNRLTWRELQLEREEENNRELRAGNLQLIGEIVGLVQVQRQLEREAMQLQEEDEEEQPRRRARGGKRGPSSAPSSSPARRPSKRSRSVSASPSPSPPPFPSSSSSSSSTAAAAAAAAAESDGEHSDPDGEHSDPDGDVSMDE